MSLMKIFDDLPIAHDGAYLVVNVESGRVVEDAATDREAHLKADRIEKLTHYAYKVVVNS